MPTMETRKPALSPRQYNGEGEQRGCRHRPDQQRNDPTRTLVNNKVDTVTKAFRYAVTSTPPASSAGHQEVWGGGRDAKHNGKEGVKKLNFGFLPMDQLRQGPVINPVREGSRTGQEPRSPSLSTLRRERSGSCRPSNASRACTCPPWYIQPRG